MTAPVSGKMGSFRIHETLTRACLFEQHQTFTGKPRFEGAGAHLARLLVLKHAEIERERATFLQRFVRFDCNAADLAWCIVGNDAGFTCQERPA